MSNSTKMKVKVISPIRHNGKLYKPGKTVTMPEAVVAAAPWCFEVLEQPQTEAAGQATENVTTEQSEKPAKKSK